MKKGRRNANHTQGEKAKRRRMPRYTCVRARKARCVMRGGFVRKAEMRECAKLQRFSKFFQFKYDKKNTNP